MPSVDEQSVPSTGVDKTGGVYRGDRGGKGYCQRLDACLTHVQGIVPGETPNLRDLSFRDPGSFPFGQLRTRIGLWEKKTFWTGTSLQRMSLNVWSIGWISKFHEAL